MINRRLLLAPPLPMTKGNGMTKMEKIGNQLLTLEVISTRVFKLLPPDDSSRPAEGMRTRSLRRAEAGRGAGEAAAVPTASPVAT
jgi:hypothetical protein